jgi:hypothetical protein
MPMSTFIMIIFCVGVDTKVEYDEVEGVIIS